MQLLNRPERTAVLSRVLTAEHPPEGSVQWADNKFAYSVPNPSRAALSSSAKSKMDLLFDAANKDAPRFVLRVNDEHGNEEYEVGLEEPSLAHDNPEAVVLRRRETDSSENGANAGNAPAVQEFRVVGKEALVLMKVARKMVERAEIMNHSRYWLAEQLIAVCEDKRQLAAGRGPLDRGFRAQKLAADYWQNRPSHFRRQYEARAPRKNYEGSVESVGDKLVINLKIAGSEARKIDVGLTKRGASVRFQYGDETYSLPVVVFKPGGKKTRIFVESGTRKRTVVGSEALGVLLSIRSAFLEHHRDVAQATQKLTKPHLWADIRTLLTDEDMASHFGY